VTDCTSMSADRFHNQKLHSKFPPLSAGFLSRISTRSFITGTFTINCVIVVAICRTLCAIFLNSYDSSGGTSGFSGGILLKIHNFHWSHTSTKDANMVLIFK
jgi:hypothetical protein